MSFSVAPPRFFASEFPNDNPALHDGAIWVCLAERGPLRPVVRPRNAAAAAARPDGDLVAASSASNPVAEPVVLTDDPRLDAPASSVRDFIDEEAPYSVRGASLPQVITGVDSPWYERVEVARDVADALPIGAPVFAASGVEDLAAVFEEAFALAREIEPIPPTLAPLRLELTPSTAAMLAEPMPSLELEGIDAAPGASGVSSSQLTFDDLASSAPSAIESDAPPRAPTGPGIRKVGSVVEASAAKPTDAYSAFVSALVAVALGAGATRAAATMPALFESGPVDFAAFPEDVQSALVRSRVAVFDDAGLAVHPTFAATAGAWRGVLRGESNDLSACCTSTLDDWGVDVLRAFGVGRDGKDVRRELRGHGVAAFGMRVAA
jgi:hypothetical protein